MPQSKAGFAADRVRHNIASLAAYFECVPAKDVSITLCTAYGVGTFDPILIEK